MTVPRMSTREWVDIVDMLRLRLVRARDAFAAYTARLQRARALAWQELHSSGV